MRAPDVRTMTTAALLAALTAVCSVLVVPIGPVPITLQVFAVALTALLLPPSAAALAMGAYLLAGAAGLPVFKGMTGGFGVLLGPTGGYLWGFLVGAVAGSWVRERLARGSITLFADGVCVATVIACTYLLGMAQLSVVTGMGGAAAFWAGVAPFVAPDVVKAVVAVGVAEALRRVVPALRPASAS